MKLAAPGAVIALCAWAAIFGPSAYAWDHETLPSSPSVAAVVSVPAGEGVALELQDPINTKSARKGDHVSLKTSSDVWANGRVAIPRGSIVRATITRAKRPGRIFGRAEIPLEFDQVSIPDGVELPLSAKLTRAGWWDPSGKIRQTASGDRGRTHDVITVSQGAASGAILGAVLGGGSGAAKGAAAGAAIGTLGILLQRGPDLDLPPGMMFEIELTKPLAIPPCAQPQEPAWQLAQGPSNISDTQLPSLPKNQPDGNAPPPAGKGSSRAAARSPTEPPPTAADRTSPPATPAAKPVDPSLAPAELANVGFKLKVSVNLVLVEATVRDERGAIVDGLKREDFRVLEDGADQAIRHFSRDELPLAVAIVVDRSGSVAPIFGKLREAALETLFLLKPEDQVALFAFDSKPERLEYLTTDRKGIAEAIANIRAGGGTNITDALFDAALYLSRAAPTRRHAVVLVSDNQTTVRGYASAGDVIRLGLESETTIYSIRIGWSRGSRYLLAPVIVPGTGSVTKMTQETGGEVFEANDGRSIKTAMAAVISRLKKRYTLGYVSTNATQDGAFRKIDVRLNGQSPASTHDYKIYARRGYYAPRAAPATATKAP